MATQRYPADFAVSGPSVDYIEMQFIRRDYKQNKVQYKSVDDLGKILINVPQKVTEAISQQFNQSGLGEMGRFLAGRSNAGAAIKDALSRTAENFLLDKSVDVANKLGATNLSAAGLLSATSGVVFNPNLEVLYEGPDFRTFNFQFNLFTKSKEDAQAIYNIVETLRIASLPSRSGETNKIQLTHTFADTAAIQTTTGALSLAGDTIAGALKGGLGKKLGEDTSALTGATGGFFANIGKLLSGASTGAGAGATAAGLLFNSDGNRFITQPPFILLRYMRGADEHPFIRPLLPAAINQINFDFTPTGNYTTVGEFNGDPKATTVGVTITMQLTEVTNLFGDKLFNDRAPGVL
tara:strand:- start:769 stop:1821 length:1053 start_codon:yes stop_codon:yes gene_type:complete